MLLPRYAAGALASVDAEAVRAHLASGCSECLEAFYRMPIGLPRDARSMNAGQPENGRPPAALAGVRIPAPAGPASGAGTSWTVGAIALAIIVVVIAWFAWMLW
jgi:hypothetical protein